MKDKKDVQEEVVNEQPNFEAGFDNEELFELNFLIQSILSYYAETGNSLDDPSEKWKKGTVQEENDGIVVPEELNIMIEKAFKKQLKKHI